MSTVTVNYVELEPGDNAPPPGTAIARPLRHVRAVRERHLSGFADAAEATASRAARAWGWALGENGTAPVTDWHTAIPPSRADIEAEIAAADDQRLRGDREHRADAAATILRWLIGDDDRVPVRCENPGELVDGFGDIVRSHGQIADVLASAIDDQRQAATFGRDVTADPDQRHRASHDADYLNGVAATLAWVLGEAGSPITRRQCQATTREIKTERLHAQDLIDQAASPWTAERLPSPGYGAGVKSAISWLLGDLTTPPTDPDAQPISKRHHR